MIFQKYSKILKYLIFFQLSCLLLGNEKLYLQKAKMLESKFLEDKNVKSISGDVVFTKGNLTLNCQEGLQYEKDGIAILFNEVSASQETRTLTCDTIKFYSKEGTLLAATSSIKIIVTGNGGHAAMPQLSNDPVVTLSLIHI